MPGAAEAIVHHTQHWMLSSRPASGEGLLVLDFSNAFNTIKREAMLPKIKETCPDFYNYAVFCYGTPAKLRGDSFVILSASGTQQGDPCGPLFFSVTVQPVLKAAAPFSTSTKSYLDDLTQCGSPPRLDESLEVIKREAAAVGLKLNEQKSQYFALEAPSLDLPCLSKIPFVPWSAGIKLLGVPLGSPGFTGSFLEKFLGKFRMALLKLSLLHCTHTASLIARHCLGAAKVTYLLRALPFDAGDFLARRSELLLRECWSEIVGTSLPDANWALAYLPIKDGGLGAHNPLVIHPFAAMPSAIFSLRLSRRRAFASRWRSPCLRLTTARLISSYSRAGDPGRLLSTCPWSTHWEPLSTMSLELLGLLPKKERKRRCRDTVVTAHQLVGTLYRW